MSLVLVLLVAAARTSTCAAETKTFIDPAPPAEAALPDLPPPQPQAHDGLTFHAAPKPLPAGAVTEDWPSFLGPRHDATSAETQLLCPFPPEGPRLVWEVTKGTGYGAPAVVGARVILLHRVGPNEVVDCLQAETGKRYWRYEYPSAYQDRYGYCNGPRCAPIVDGDRVYTFGAEGKLHCLTLQTGQVRWKRDILAEFNLRQNFFGVGATPLVEGSLLIVNVGADGGGPCVAAFDKASGRLVWGAGEQWGPSYASPVPAVLRGKRRVLVFAGGESRPATGGLLCVDPTNGQVDFAFPWRGKRYESVNASCPVAVGDDRVFVSECYGRGSAMLEIATDLTAKPAWTDAEFGTHFMTAILKDGHLYGVHGHGPLDCPLVCLKADSGAEVWRHEPEWEETIARNGQQRQVKMGLARATLLLAEGRFLTTGEYGHLLWLNLSPQGYKEICRSWLFAAGESWTPPVISHGLLYICQNSRDNLHDQPPRLLCYDLRAEH